MQFRKQYLEFYTQLINYSSFAFFTLRISSARSFSARASEINCIRVEPRIIELHMRSAFSAEKYTSV